MGVDFKSLETSCRGQEQGKCSAGALPYRGQAADPFRCRRREGNLEIHG